MDHKQVGSLFDISGAVLTNSILWVIISALFLCLFMFWLSFPFGKNPPRLPHRSCRCCRSYQDSEKRPKVPIGKNRGRQVRGLCLLNIRKGASSVRTLCFSLHMWIMCIKQNENDWSPDTPLFLSLRTAGGVKAVGRHSYHFQKNLTGCVREVRPCRWMHPVVCGCRASSGHETPNHWRPLINRCLLCEAQNKLKGFCCRESSFTWSNHQWNQVFNKCQIDSSGHWAHSAPCTSCCPSCDPDGHGRALVHLCSVDSVRAFLRASERLCVTCPSASIWWTQGRTGK